MRALSPREVYAEIGPSADTVWTMIRAERYGQACAYGALVIHAGYMPDATEFSASTSLYYIRW